MRALLLCLFLAACAAPERHELRDGAPVRTAPVFVTPGYTPAGAGLPEYMPGHPEPVRIEPNPRPARLLPQTPETRREPRIWATNEPDAPHVNDDGKPAPLVLGERLPYEDFQYEPKDREHVRRCATKGDAALRSTLKPDQIDALTKDERKCLAMSMYALCGHYWWDPKITIMDETLTRDDRSVLNQLAMMSDRRFKAACHTTPTNLTGRVQSAFANAAAKWHEMSR